MRRLLLPCFLLLALGALPISAIEAQDLEGDTYASISPAALSSLGVNVAELEMEVCNLSTSGQDRGAVLVILNDGGGVHPASIRTAVVATTPSHSHDTIQVWVQPTFLHAVGAEPLEFECGTYTYRLALNGAEIQPISPLILTPAASGANHGTITGILSVHTLLILEPVGVGSPFQQPRTLGLKINGHYSLLLTEDVRLGDSRLQLFATELDGRAVSAPAWADDVNDPGTLLWLEPPAWRLPPRE